MKASKPTQACRTCLNKEIDEILDLGLQPLANALSKTSNTKEDTYPLKIFRCRVCGTVQLTETIEPGILFKQYVWVTGTSSTAIRYSKSFAMKALQRSTKTKNYVIEIASNDGTFLKEFQVKGNKVLGIDPAINIAEIANQDGVPTIPKFFGNSIAHEVVNQNGKADIVFARNVIPHVANADDVIKGMATCLADEGLGIIEFHSAEKIVTELHYDSIYHEHLYYHSIKSINHILSNHSLYIYDIESSPISGGSHVIYFSKTKKEKTSNLKKAEAYEDKIGINRLDTWQKFAYDCNEQRIKLKRILEELKKDGNKIVGYGASARSSTLLNYCSIDNRYLMVIADKANLKTNMYTPGTNIKIMMPEEVLKMKPDVILLTAWNFKEEIINELKNKYMWRGKVILPLPGMPQIYEIK